MSATLTAVLALSAVTWAIKGAGPLLWSRVPPALSRRLSGLAPALLAGLVMTEMTGPDGSVDIDAKLAGVAVALLLAWRKAPLWITVSAGAAVAAGLRAAT